MNELTPLRIRVEELLTIYYSPQTRYPVTTSYGKQLGDVPSTLEELNTAFSAFSRKQAEVLAVNKVIRQANSTYSGIDLQPIVPDEQLRVMGYMKRFNIGLNKFIFFDLSGNEVPSPI